MAISNIDQTRTFKYLWTLISLYVLITVTSDLAEGKIITLLWLHSGAGLLSFTFSYFLIEIITEVYGYKRGRFSIWLGIFFCFIFVFLAFIITRLPYPNNEAEKHMTTLIINTQRVFLSTIITVVFAENLNAYIIAKLKQLFRGKYTGIRFVCSTFVATFVSMLIFSVFAFYHRISNSNFVFLTLTSWLYRFITEILLIPFSVAISKWLKRKEEVDIYDTNTNFTIFSLDNQYSQSQNRYSEEHPNDRK